MRIKLILGWLYAVILCLIYALFLYVCRDVIELQNPRGSLLFLAFLFPVLFAIFIVCCLGVSWFCRRRHLDSRGYWRFALLVLLTIPIAFLMHDASPIEHDYSMKDIVPKDQKILESYDTLMMFRRHGDIKFETSASLSDFTKFLTNVLVHSESISRDWDNIVSARSAIEKLDTYPGITDLTPQVKLDWNTPILGFVTLPFVGRIYGAYAILKTAEGHPEEAARHLAKLHSVIRKALPYSMIIVDKGIWITMAHYNIEAAFAIMQQPQCNHDTLEILKQGFPPIAEDDVSPRRVFIAEYVGFKTKREDIMNNFGRNHKYIRSLAFYLTFKKNRTFRDARKYLDLLIEGIDKHPLDMSNAETYAKRYPQHLDIRNPGGWHFVSCSMLSLTRYSEAAIKTKILSDLLAIEIGNRLDQPVFLNDYYSGAPYGRDELTGRVYSVGPDRKPNTDDDIVLGKQYDN